MYIYIYVRLTSFIAKYLSYIYLVCLYVAFCAYVSSKVFFRSHTIPTPVLLYYPVWTGNIAYLMSRILFRPHLFPRVAVIRCAPILQHAKACTTFRLYYLAELSLSYRFPSIVSTTSTSRHRFRPALLLSYWPSSYSSTFQPSKFLTSFGRC